MVSSERRAVANARRRSFSVRIDFICRRRILISQFRTKSSNLRRFADRDGRIVTIRAVRYDRRRLRCRATRGVKFRFRGRARPGNDRLSSSMASIGEVCLVRGWWVYRARCKMIAPTPRESAYASYATARNDTRRAPAVVLLFVRYCTRRRSETRACVCIHVSRFVRVSMTVCRCRAAAAFDRFYPRVCAYTYTSR